LQALDGHPHGGLRQLRGCQAEAPELRVAADPINSAALPAKGASREITPGFSNRSTSDSSPHTHSNSAPGAAPASPPRDDVR